MAEKTQQGLMKNQPVKLQDLKKKMLWRRRKYRPLFY